MRSTIKFAICASVCLPLVYVPGQVSAGVAAACTTSATSSTCDTDVARSITTSDSGTASESSETGVRQVAVFDEESEETALKLSKTLNKNPGIHATVVDQAEVVAGALQGYDCVVSRVLGKSYGPPQALVTALREYVLDGGGYIGEWQGAAAALSESVPSIDADYYVPKRYMGLFAGGTSDGDFVQRGNTIQRVSGHAVVRHLPEHWRGGGGTEYFVRATGLDKRLNVVATYQGHGGTNPAIAVGHLSEAHVVLLFFDAIDSPKNPRVATLWKNSVEFACPAQ